MGTYTKVKIHTNNIQSVHTKSSATISTSVTFDVMLNNRRSPYSSVNIKPSSPAKTKYTESTKTLNVINCPLNIWSYQECKRYQLFVYVQQDFIYSSVNIKPSSPAKTKDKVINLNI